jgi:hypothetical protein
MTHGPPLKSLREQITALGLSLDSDLELRDCDAAVRCVAYVIAQREVNLPLPNELLETLETFSDLTTYANLRLSQEGRSALWTP